MRVAGGGVSSVERAPRTWTTSPPTPSGCRASSHRPLLAGQLPSSRPSSTADLSRRGREPKGRSSLGPRGDGEQEVSILQRSNSPSPNPPGQLPPGAPARGAARSRAGVGHPTSGPRARSSRGSRAAPPGHSSAGPSHPARGRTRTPHRARPAPIGARAATWRGFPGCLEQLPGSRFQLSAPQPSSGLAHCGLGRATPPPDRHYLGRNS